MCHHPPIPIFRNIALLERKGTWMQNADSLMPRGKSGWSVLICFTVLSLLAAACAPDKAMLRKQADQHRTRVIGHWGAEWQRKPLAERIAPAPPDLIEKIGIENRLLEFPERPTPTTPTPEFTAAFRKVESILPEQTRKLAQERIVGLFLVRDLGGTGYTEAILDEAGIERYAMIVLDRDVLLKRRASGWSTWKENSCFKPLPGRNIDLAVRLEADRDDTLENAIVYILLHEIGHALGMASGIHPSWNGDTVVSGDYPFTLLSWRMHGNDVESLFDDAFPERKALRAYAFDRAEVTADQVLNVYRKLARTNFPTLYAAASLWEDFAESFVNYLHVVREMRPYEIRIGGAMTPEEIIHPCWNEERCAAKRAFLEKWLEDPSQIPLTLNTIK